MSLRLWEIRKLGPDEVKTNALIPLGLPIVKNGLKSVQAVQKWAEQNSLQWVGDHKMLFGGYYRCAAGNCYYPGTYVEK